ncbi:molybdenum cofactor biosynthesis protein MoeA [Chitinophaga silvatica]|uniref:Molybdenum cofactor biosynthesis protein MoeA n=1 Tax=Chitinophaga silvatica TaxID=2282649 RepID=A0A3E1YEI8_9BACT|nr:SMI1/KNR4 family protein [Chitinophaga silvatica]RFS24982.1 molybdenum cofactor biosynthesis protein MoeA [Chitinophaga silvatica]
MQQHWARWENWMKNEAAPLLELLNPPATLNELSELETLIQTKLPPSLIDFYLIHNGQKEARMGLMDADFLLSIDGIIDEWKTWNKFLVDEGDIVGVTEPDKGIKGNWYNPLWIPITYDGSGNNICIDFDPAPGGTKGQIITMWHDSMARELLAPSFEAWISDYITSIEEGKRIFVQDWGIVKTDSVYAQQK